MRPVGLVVIVLAWAALQVPWERCRSLCHDRLLPALGEHSCHEGHENAGDAGEAPGEHNTCAGTDTDTDTDHESVEFASVRPDAPVFLAAVPVSARLLGRDAHASSAFDATPARDLLPTPRPTIVLRL